MKRIFTTIYEMLVKILGRNVLKSKQKMNDTRNFRQYPGKKSLEKRNVENYKQLKTIVRAECKKEKELWMEENSKEIGDEQTQQWSIHKS